MIAPETIAALPILTASLLGSAHCVGMCGGFVALYSSGTGRNVLPHVLYNLGRLTTYMLLGGGAALLGRGIDSLSGIARFSSLLVGVVLIVLGLRELFRTGSSRSVPSHERFGTLVAGVMSRVMQSDRSLKPYLIGLVTTFLPCGWLYGFVGLALGAAEVRTALLIMFIFWIGTLPLMISFGLLSREVIGRLGGRAPRVTAALMIMSGLLSLTLHLAHGSHNHATSGSHPTHSHSN